jgi:hypothetical protein
MSAITDILDRLTDIRSLRVQVEVMLKEQLELRNVVLRQHNEIAEMRGQLKAMLQIQSAGAKRGA